MVTNKTINLNRVKLPGFPSVLRIFCLGAEFLIHVWGFWSGLWSVLYHLGLKDLEGGVSPISHNKMG